MGLKSITTPNSPRASIGKQVRRSDYSSGSQHENINLEELRISLNKVALKGEHA